jgi:chromate reductase
MNNSRKSARHRLLGLSGSLRTGAYSTALLAAFAEATALQAIWANADIGALPLFNQDLYVDPLPAAVAFFREQIAAADAIVIVSPEYNHGIPGGLKNALDWASRPHNGSPLKNKPVLIATSSHAFTGGVRAQYQIRETVVSALARPVTTPEIVVGLIAAKIIDGRFEDATTIAFARQGFNTMFEALAQTASGDAS